MLPFPNYQIPPVSNWQDFELLCCDLWRKIWADPNIQRNGRKGQKQNGVDIFGRPNGDPFWAGIQCKCKNILLENNLTESEVKEEVQNAKNFVPKLSEYIIATTGPKDAKIEELARKITQENLKEGFFSVTIWSWEDIVGRLDDFPEVRVKYYPQMNNDTKEITKEFNLSMLTTEYQQELKYSSDLIENKMTKTALEYLESLKNRIWTTAQPIVKYQILKNMGLAKLKMNQQQEAATNLIEAWKYNPDDENSLCN